MAVMLNIKEKKNNNKKKKHEKQIHFDICHIFMPLKEFREAY